MGVAYASNPNTKEENLFQGQPCLQSEFQTVRATLENPVFKNKQNQKQQQNLAINSQATHPIHRPPAGAFPPLSLLPFPSLPLFPYTCSSLLRKFRSKASSCPYHPFPVTRLSDTMSNSRHPPTLGPLSSQCSQPFSVPLVPLLCS